MKIIKLKEMISEFDYESGMAYCGEDEEFFSEMLSDYANSDRPEKLTKFYNEKDWKNYAIEVHTLKGNSRMMGLPQLGAKCEELQNAAKAMDEEILLSKHDIMMKDYLEYIKCIKEIM